MREKRAIVELDNKLANRSVNEGFSGGEKKRNEIFQMAMLEPTFAILDETDSGLDVDALRIVADGFNKLKTAETSAMVITHYQRLLDYIKPDTVHVLLGGRIVKTGGPELAKEIQRRREPPYFLSVSRRRTKKVAKKPLFQRLPLTEVFFVSKIGRAHV